MHIHTQTYATIMKHLLEACCSNNKIWGEKGGGIIMGSMGQPLLITPKKFKCQQIFCWSQNKTPIILSELWIIYQELHLWRLSPCFSNDLSSLFYSSHTIQNLFLAAIMHGIFSILTFILVFFVHLVQHSVHSQWSHRLVCCSLADWGLCLYNRYWTA